MVHCRKFFESPYLGKAEQPQEQCYPFLLVCAVFSCIQTMVWQCWGFLTCGHMLMHVITHKGCKDTTLKVHSWQKYLAKVAALGTRTRIRTAPGFSVTLYWVIQAGLLTPLTFARHRWSPLAAFTYGAYFLHNGRRWQWICEFYTANFKDIFGGP